jgi:hypothetical protein
MTAALGLKHSVGSPADTPSSQATNGSATQYVTSAMFLAPAQSSVLPELLMQRRGFYSRGGGHDRWKSSRPYHVALEDSYIRTHWEEINALCRLNSIPLNATGEKIRDGSLWCVFEFAWQMDAIFLGYVQRTLAARERISLPGAT